MGRPRVVYTRGRDIRLQPITVMKDFKSSGVSKTVVSPGFITNGVLFVRIILVACMQVILE